MAEVWMTQERKDELEKELEWCLGPGRNEAKEKLRVAREFGDLSENAEYDIAKAELAKLEDRIKTLEETLRNAKIYVNSKTVDKVGLGNRVTILNLGTGEESEYEIVGSQDANPMESKISNGSPVGSALMGKKAGDEVEVKVRIGTVKYRIVNISLNDEKKS